MLDPELEQRLRAELTYQRARRAPIGFGLCLFFGLIAALFGVYFLGVLLRFFGWQ